MQGKSESWENTIRVALMSCMDRELDVMGEEMESFDYVPSRRFQRKIKKLFWGEKYFGEYARAGYMLRRAAVVVAVIALVFVAGTVSAKVFGFRPWKYLVSFSEEDKMDVRVYESLNIDKTEGGYPKTVHNAPAFVPEGYRKDGEMLAEKAYRVKWSDGAGRTLMYVRNSLQKGEIVSVDSEYTRRDTVQVMGYEGFYYEKGMNAWIMWDDTECIHQIMMEAGDGSREEAVKMAVSLYE